MLRSCTITVDAAVVTQVLSTAQVEYSTVASGLATTDVTNESTLVSDLTVNVVVNTAGSVA